MHSMTKQSRGLNGSREFHMIVYIPRSRLTKTEEENVIQRIPPEADEVRILQAACRMGNV